MTFSCAAEIDVCEEAVGRGRTSTEVGQGRLLKGNVTISDS